MGKRKRVDEEEEEEEGAPRAKVSRTLQPATRPLHCGSPGLCSSTTVSARTFPTNLYHLLEEEEEEEEEVQFRDASVVARSLCLASPSHLPCTSPFFTSRAGRPAPAVLALLLQGEQEGLREEGEQEELGEEGEHEEQELTLHFFV